MAPERTVPAAVRAGLHSDGFKTSAFVPQRFRASDVDRAALVVSFVARIDLLIDELARGNAP